MFFARQSVTDCGGSSNRGKSCGRSKREKAAFAGPPSQTLSTNNQRSGHHADDLQQRKESETDRPRIHKPTPLGTAFYPPAGIGSTKVPQVAGLPGQNTEPASSVQEYESSLWCGGGSLAQETKLMTNEFTPYTPADLAAMPERLPLRTVWRQLVARGLKKRYGALWAMAHSAEIPAHQAFNGLWTVAREDLPTIFEAFKLQDRRLKPKKIAA